MNTAASPAKTISRIDREIDAITRELRRLEKVKPMSAASWQKAWDKHPDLQARERELHRQRGVAQQERDAIAQKVWAREQRQRRSKKCPTCGHQTLVAA